MGSNIKDYQFTGVYLQTNNQYLADEVKVAVQETPPPKPGEEVCSGLVLRRDDFEEQLHLDRVPAQLASKLGALFGPGLVADKECGVPRPAWSKVVPTRVDPEALRNLRSVFVAESDVRTLKLSVSGPQIIEGVPFYDVDVRDGDLYVTDVPNGSTNPRRFLAREEHKAALLEGLRNLIERQSQSAPPQSVVQGWADWLNPPSGSIAELEAVAARVASANVLPSGSGEP